MSRDRERQSRWPANVDLSQAIETLTLFTLVASGYLDAHIGNQRVWIQLWQNHSQTHPTHEGQLDKAMQPCESMT